jgi:hypothetical protein
MIEQNGLIIIIGFLFYLINLAFLISGSVILTNTDTLSSSDEDFHIVWVCNLVLTIISGLSAFIQCTTCCGSNKKDDDSNGNNNIFEAISLAISIWALVLWFEKINLSNLEQQYFSLFMLMKIRVYYTLVLFGLASAIIVGFILFCCFSCCSTNETKPNKKNKVNLTGLDENLQVTNV